MATIGSLMSTEIITAQPGETISHAAYVMTTNGVGAVLVVEDEKLVGVLSERDILTRLVGEGGDVLQTRVDDIASAEPITVSRDTPVRECSQLMRDKQIRHLAVVEEGRPVGIVSARDLFGFVAASLERTVDEKQYADALASNDDPYDHPGGSYGR